MPRTSSIRRRATHLAVAVALALPVALIATASPADAAQVCKGTAANSPDGRIALNNGPFLGSGSYPATASLTSLPAGGSATWKLKWKNVSSGPRTVAVDLHSVVGGNNFSVKYYLGAQNVTQTLKSDGTLDFPNLVPGVSTPTLDVVIKRKTAASGGVIVRLRGWYAPTLGRPPCDGLFPSANLQF